MNYITDQETLYGVCMQSKQPGFKLDISIARSIRSPKNGEVTQLSFTLTDESTCVHDEDEYCTTTKACIFIVDVAKCIEWNVITQEDIDQLKAERDKTGSEILIM